MGRQKGPTMNQPKDTPPPPTVERMTQLAAQRLEQMVATSGRKPSPQAIRIAAGLIARRAAQPKG